MPYLRIVRNEKTFSAIDPDIDGAVKSWREDSGIASVYKVDDQAMGDRVCTLMALVVKNGPESMRYILVGDEVFGQLGMNVLKTRCDVNHPLLEACHHDLHGVDADQTTRGLVTAIRNSAATFRQRIRFESLSDATAKRLLLAEVLDPVHGRLRWNWSGISKNGLTALPRSSPLQFRPFLCSLTYFCAGGDCCAKPPHPLPVLPMVRPALVHPAKGAPQSADAATASHDGKRDTELRAGAGWKPHESRTSASSHQQPKADTSPLSSPYSHRSKNSRDTG